MGKLTLEDKVRQAFERDTAEHQLTVLKDDGLYRHLRCQAPGTWCYGFDIVTWPGYLFIGGDVETYVFARIPDMFEFFGDGTKYSGGINPQYWAQKLQGDRRGSDISRRYTPESFRARMLEWVRQECEEGDCEMYPSLLIEALDRDVGLDFGYEENAREALRELEDEGILPETWEWDLKDYDSWYLWCCWAIVWAIERYSADRVAVAA